MQQASSSIISKLKVHVDIDSQQANDGADYSEAHSMELVHQSIDHSSRIPADARLVADHTLILPAVLPT